MKNLFKNAKFGDKFVTRDNRIALYLGQYTKGVKHTLIYLCWIYNETEPIEYDETGLSFPDVTRCINDDMSVELWDTDIISKYQELINEQKLNVIASEYVMNLDEGGGPGCYDDVSMEDAFKAGYRKAKEE